MKVEIELNTSKQSRYVISKQGPIKKIMKSGKTLIKTCSKSSLGIRVFTYKYLI